MGSTPRPPDGRVGGGRSFKKTRAGYWDWVATRLKPAEQQTSADPALADAEEAEFEELQAEDPGNQGA